MTQQQLMMYTLKDHALRCDLPWVLVLAIVEVESGGDVHAFRSEPAYRYLWDVGKHCAFRQLSHEEVARACSPEDFDCDLLVCSVDSEWAGQKASWGPMQVMGAVARERGFDGPFPELCSADEGIYWGCRQLQWLKGKHHDEHGWPGVVSAYNQGSPRKGGDGRYRNQVYVDKVFGFLSDIVADLQRERLHAPAA